MDFPTEKIKTYREYLKICEYPNIEKLDGNEILNIFNKENRVHFLTWVLTKLLPACESRLEISRRNKKLETTIADLLCVNGFCKIEEKNNFVIKSGIKIEQEVVIFNRIFNSLTALYNNTDKENVSSERASLKYYFQHPNKDDFDQKVLCDASNIFPDNLKVISEKEKVEKHKKLTADIKELDQQISEAENEKSELLKFFNNSAESEIPEEEINELVEKLQNLIKSFHEEFPEYSVNFTNSPNTAKNLNLGPVLEKSSQNLDHIIKVLESKQCMMENQELPTFEEREGSTSEDYTDFIINNYVISEEILNKSFKIQ